MRCRTQKDIFDRVPLTRTAILLPPEEFIKKAMGTLVLSFTVKPVILQSSIKFLNLSIVVVLQVVAKY